jgi:prefoldin subunit 1
VSRQQTATKDRERRILQLTIDEIGQMEGDVNLYKGVGKMFVPGGFFYFYAVGLVLTGL